MLVIEQVIIYCFFIDDHLCFVERADKSRRYMRTIAWDPTQYLNKDNTT